MSGSVLFVMAATALDVFTASGVNREKGKLLSVEGERSWFKAAAPRCVRPDQYAYCP